MPEDEFEISDLREALLQERNTKQLTEIRHGFYRKLREYLKEIKKEVEEVGFPSDSRSKALHREYNRAKNHADDLFSRRTQKVALAAVHHVSGSTKVDTDNMTDREEEFFYDVVDLLEEMEDELFFGGYKREVTSEEEKVDEEKKVSKTTKEEPVIDSSLSDEEVKDKIEHTEAKGIEEETNGQSFDKKSFVEDLNETSKEKPMEILIHVVEKIPPFVDMDATYDLKKEDVVTLREDIASVLIKRGKARKIELD